MGVVGLPSRVTGLRAISIIEEITFIPGCQASSNSSQRGLSLGEAWRRILKRTDLSGIRRGIFVFPKTKNNRNKFHREGHEFHSSRFSLSEDARLPAAEVCFEASTTNLPAGNVLCDVLDLAAPETVRRRMSRPTLPEGRSMDIVARAAS